MKTKINKIIRSRHIYMIIMGFIVSFLVDLIMSSNSIENRHNKLIDAMFSIFMTVVIWEGNLKIDDWMDKTFLWDKNPFKRVSVQGILSMLFSSLMIYFAMVIFTHFLCEIPTAKKSSLVTVSIIIGVLVSLLLLATEIGIQFFKKWKVSIMEVEKHKKETIQAQLENLKNQINPHFLFNNLSVLSSLVYKDQDKSVEFINRLAKVYRYVLDSKDKELVELSTELTFIQSYFFLLETRFDTNIKTIIRVDENFKSYLMPPMALQMLVENCIKHNEVSTEQPLTISIETINDCLVVSNNLQLRKTPEESSKTGISNIISRYKYFTEDSVEVKQTADKFIVKLPLIKK